MQSTIGMMHHLLSTEFLETTKHPLLKIGYRRVNTFSSYSRKTCRLLRIGQKMYANRHQIEHNFEVGDLVSLRLKCYRQSKLKKRSAETLKPRFYGPYKVLLRVGKLAYELELLSDNRIHNVFHVSCLKKFVGQ